MNRIDIIEMAPPGTGVEVGVCEGSFSEAILKSSWEGTLYSIDIWRHRWKVYQDPSNVSDEEHEENYQRTIKRLRPYKDRSIVLREASVDAARGFEPNSLSFVYIDAAHDYRSVFADCKEWFPKVKEGGIIAGHDYFTTRNYRKNNVEVKLAVDQFFYPNVVETTGERRLPSWYYVK